MSWYVLVTTGPVLGGVFMSQYVLVTSDTVMGGVSVSQYVPVTTGPVLGGGPCPHISILVGCPCPSTDWEPPRRAEGLPAGPPAP